MILQHSYWKDFLIIAWSMILILRRTQTSAYVKGSQIVWSDYKQTGDSSEKLSGTTTTESSDCKGQFMCRSFKEVI